MKEPDNPILDAVTTLIDHPVWDENLNVSAEKFKVSMKRCPYVSDYVSEDLFYSGDLFRDRDHISGNRMGAMWYTTNPDNGMIRSILTYTDLEYPLRSTYPSIEILHLLETRFGKPVTHARQDLFFEEDSSSSVNIYSTPAGEARICIVANPDDGPITALQINVILSPNLDAQEPTWR